MHPVSVILTIAKNHEDCPEKFNGHGGDRTILRKASALARGRGKAYLILLCLWRAVIMDLAVYLKERRRIIEEALGRYLPSPGTEPKRIHEAMRYSVFAGGKRLRPILCLAAAESLGRDPLSALPAACALELVHTYSLMHDDLPCMDNDNLRRGKPTSHRVFGEAVALLAGNALLTKAFELVSLIETAPPPVILELVNRLARCSGSQGLLGGQVLDISTGEEEVEEHTLEYIQSHKTATLIETSVLFGAQLGDATQEQRSAFGIYGHSLGMAFQITDDILDITGNEMKMGKKARKDTQAKKATYAAFYGLDTARYIAGNYIDKAIEVLLDFDDKAQPLREIARSVMHRER
jgi:geranylgeranyl diphosphate synthase type II